MIGSEANYKKFIKYIFDGEGVYNIYDSDVINILKSFYDLKPFYETVKIAMNDEIGEVEISSIRYNNPWGIKNDAILYSVVKVGGLAHLTNIAFRNGKIYTAYLFVKKKDSFDHEGSVNVKLIEKGKRLYV